MAICSTEQIGAQVLRETATPVPDITDKAVQRLVEDLKDTMRSEGLVGIAAPQIGESVRIILSEIREGNARNVTPEPLTVYINPVIIGVSHETETDYEGCGSIAGGKLFGKVERPMSITVSYTDETGVSREKSASGLLARIIQHEIDHLAGILFTDKVEPKSLLSREHYLTMLSNKTSASLEID